MIIWLRIIVIFLLMYIGDWFNIRLLDTHILPSNMNVITKHFVQFLSIRKLNFFPIIVFRSFVYNVCRNKSMRIAQRKQQMQQPCRALSYARLGEKINLLETLLQPVLSLCFGLIFHVMFAVRIWQCLQKKKKWKWLQINTLHSFR